MCGPEALIDANGKEVRMPYYEVKLSSSHFCGFDETRYFQAENETALYNSYDFQEFEEYLKDWIDGSLEFEYESIDMGDDVLELDSDVREISKEEYEEYKE